MTEIVSEKVDLLDAFLRLAFMRDGVRTPSRRNQYSQTRYAHMVIGDL